MKKQTNVRYLVQLSLLAAIELVMAYTPLGYLRVFALEITFLMVPVTLGAILLGPAAGAVLGGVFGLTSFATCFSVSGFGDVLLSINPVFTFLVCVPTRILVMAGGGAVQSDLCCRAENRQPPYGGRNPYPDDLLSG